MDKFCSNCGAELNEAQDVCLGCGKVISKPNEKKSKDHNVYIMISSILMIVLGLSLLTLISQSLWTFGLPGMLGIAAGIFALFSKKNKVFLLVSGILFIVSTIINSISIADVSIYGILAVIFGIMNIIYSRN